MLDYERIKSISAQLGLMDIVIEKDYVLDWVLWGISQDEYLKNILVFKGGTALHKIWFPSWRFSEDLDYTSIDPISAETLREATLRFLPKIMDAAGLNLRLKDIEKSGNFGDERSLEVKMEYIGPRKQTGGNLPTILLHITNNELIVDEPVKKTIIAPYEDLPSNFSILTYSLEEIIAEKLRTVFYQRCWPRDIYDLWRSLIEAGNLIDIEKLINIFERKCTHRGFEMRGIPVQFDDRVQRIKNQWKEGLQRQIAAPPDFEVVFPDLKQKLNNLFNNFYILAKGGINMIESKYVIRYKRGDFEIEVQGDKTFVEEKFKELASLKLEPKSKGLTPQQNIDQKELKELSLVEFVNEKDPKSHGDKILTFAYFLEKNKGYESFNLDDIEKCYQDARIPKTKNFSPYITQLIREGFIMDSEQKKDNKKAWALTSKGSQYIENLPASKAKE